MRRGETPPIPENSITKPPSAELRPGQLDTDSLPDYEVLDAILAGYVDGDLGRDDLVAAGHDPAVVDRVLRMVDLAEYKRRQSAPGTKISIKAFGRDRRLPITNRFRERADRADRAVSQRCEIFHCTADAGPVDGATIGSDPGTATARPRGERRQRCRIHSDVPAVPSLYGGPATRRVRTRDLLAAKERGERWPMLTSYDQYTAAIFDEAGIPVLLVGDSAANNVFGYETTLPVTVDELLPAGAGGGPGHQARAGRRRPAVRLVRGGPDPGAAHRRAVHEGEAAATPSSWRAAGACAPQIAAITGAGIPVMAHIGFTPQSEHTIGGYRVQGRGDAAEEVVADARAVAEAGAFAVVLEMVPGEVAKRITHELAIPTVGIGAGPDTDAQVLVWQDMAGLRTGQAAALRQAVRRPGRRADRRGRPVRRRGARRDVPGRRAHVPLIRRATVGRCPTDRTRAALPCSPPPSPPWPCRPAAPKGPTPTAASMPAPSHSTAAPRPRRACSASRRSS